MLSCGSLADFFPEMADKISSEDYISYVTVTISSIYDLTADAFLWLCIAVSRFAC